MLEAPSHHDGFKVVLAIIALLLGVAVIFTQVRAIDKERTLQAQERTYQVQAQSQVQIAAEKERTERAVVSESTKQRAAELRAEGDARTTNIVSIIGAVGAIAVLGLLILAFFVFGMNWAEGKQLQRTLLLIEAQREARMMLYSGRQPDAGEIMLLAASQQQSRVRRTQ